MSRLPSGQITVLVCAGRHGDDTHSLVIFAGRHRIDSLAACRSYRSGVSFGGRAGALQELFQRAEVASDRRLDCRDG